MCLYLVGKRLYNIFQSSEKPPHSCCSKIPMMMAFFQRDPVASVQNCILFFPNLFVFSIFLPSCTYITMQDLQTKRPIAVQSSISCFCHLDISSSLSGGHKTTTRSPVVTTGTDPDKSGTNLYRLSNLQKSTGRIFTFFLDLSFK